MLSEDNNKSEKFDSFLKDSLKRYRPPMPDDFPLRMLSKLQEMERQEALRKVIWQERLIWAAGILLPAAAVISFFIFPDILTASQQLLADISLFTRMAVDNIVQYWQVWSIFAAIAALISYAVYDVLLANN